MSVSKKAKVECEKKKRRHENDRTFRVVTSMSKTCESLSGGGLQRLLGKSMMEEEFLNKYWGKEPLHISRSRRMGIVEEGEASRVKKRLGARTIEEEEEAARLKTRMGRTTITTSSSEEASRSKKRLGATTLSEEEASRSKKRLGATTTSSEEQAFQSKKRLETTTTSSSEEAFELNFGAKDLIKLLDQEQKLKYGKELKAVRCEDGKEMKIVHEDDKAAIGKGIVNHLKKGNTIQFFHPQRYHDDVFNLMKCLEEQFTSLWGCSIYLTPSNSQGLAPHYDDVEVFVLQTNGTKKWKLYRPNQANELALEHSNDLDVDTLEEKNLIFDIELQQGDVLYMPRGTIHYAVACSNQESCHFTLSTHQNQSYYNLLDIALPRMLDAAASNNISFRHGLPIGFLSCNGTWNHNEGKNKMNENIVKLLRSMADMLETSKVDEDGSVKQALHESIDEFGIDYIKNRLPPPPSMLLSKKKKKQILLTDQVRIVSPSLLHIQLAPSGDDDDDDDDDEHDEMLRIYHSLLNNRAIHLSSNPNSNFVELPHIAIPFLKQLWNQYPSFETIKKTLHSIKVDEHYKNGDYQSALNWVQALYKSNIVQVL